ncbi:MAG TPA: outer membrane protein assembly factor BamE [Steroidobacteraceae bacterium]
MRLLQPERLSAPAVRLAIALLVCLGTPQACVYRMTIQQGNFLEPRSVDKLEVGMTRSQVRYLLGTPMVPDTFDLDRWDYVYYLKKGRVHGPVHRRLTVYFEGDKVAKVEKEGENVAPKTDPVSNSRSGV